MNSIERLKSAVQNRHPAARVQVDHYRSGKIWFDVRLGNKLVVVEYRPRKGYGVSSLVAGSGWDGYAEVPERTFRRYADVEQYVLGQLGHATGRARPGRASAAPATARTSRNPPERSMPSKSA